MYISLSLYRAARGQGSEMCRCGLPLTQRQSQSTIRDRNLYTTTNKCLQCLVKHNVYSILNNWCICINLSLAILFWRLVPTK